MTKHLNKPLKEGSVEFDPQFRAVVHHSRGDVAVIPRGRKKGKLIPLHILSGGTEEWMVMVCLHPLFRFPDQKTDHAMPSTFRMNLSFLSLYFPGNTQQLEIRLLDLTTKFIATLCKSFLLPSSLTLFTFPFLRISQIKSESPTRLPVSHSLLFLAPTPC